MVFYSSLLATALLLFLSTAGGSNSPHKSKSPRTPKSPHTPRSPNAGSSLNPFFKKVNEYQEQASLSKPISIPQPVSIKENAAGGPWKSTPPGSPKSLLRGSLATSQNVFLANIPKKGSPTSTSPSNLSPRGKYKNSESTSKIESPLQKKNSSADVSPTKRRQNSTVSTSKDENEREKMKAKCPSVSPSRRNRSPESAAKVTSKKVSDKRSASPPDKRQSSDTVEVSSETLKSTSGSPSRRRPEVDSSSKRTPESRIASRSQSADSTTPKVESFSGAPKNVGKYVIPARKATSDWGKDREVPDKSYSEVLARSRKSSSEVEALYRSEVDELNGILKKSGGIDPKDTSPK